MSVVVEQRDRVLVITIDRPRARNAVDRAVSDGIAAALDRLESSGDLSVGVLTGAGGTFCSGMDLKAFVAGEDVESPTRGFGGITGRPASKPMIAAVEGWALAGGCELALACDLIVASEEASFGIPEVTRGLIAGAGGLLRLPQRIPPAIAAELALTGDPLPAVRAHALGLVNLLTPPGGALAGALALAGRIVAHAPLALRGTKRVLDHGLGRPVAQAWGLQREVLAEVMASDDAREGSLAFAEKRPPRWQGR